MAKRKTPKITPASTPVKKPPGKTVATLRHDEASRKNIPTAEHQSMIEREQQSPVRVAYERRNRDLDPQLVWRGKDEQDWSDLVVHAPPLYIQEKVHPKALIDDLLRRSQARQKAAEPQLDLFADFNGLPDADARTEFYRHDANWSNRMILGDSLQVMASLAEREGLRGQVHLPRPALRHQVQLQFPVVHHEPGCQRWQHRSHHARAGAGEGVSGHVARRDSHLSHVSARSPYSGARSSG